MTDATTPPPPPFQQPVQQPAYRPAKRLVRPRDDRWIGGVCGGWARYLNIDATLVRVLAVIAFIFSGFFPIGVLYLIAWALTPKE